MQKFVGKHPLAVGPAFPQTIVLPNLALKSQNIGTAPWGAFHASVTEASTAAPDGTTTANLISILGDAFAGTVFQAFTFGGVQTGAVWVRSSTSTAVIYVMFGDGVTFYRTAVTLSTLWQRVSITTPANTVSQAWNLAIGYDTRDGTQLNPGALNMYAWGVTVNPASYATPYRANL